MLKAVAASLQEFPELNARLEGDEIVYLDRYDLGVAVQTDQGLVVPVVRDCDDARASTSSRDEVARLAEAARAGTLKPEELRGSTFTVTSAGKLGGLLTTPIVNHPEVAILSVGRIAERPVVRDGEIVARPDRLRSRSPSTTASSTAPARPSSASPSSSASRRGTTRRPAARVHRPPFVEGQTLRARAGRAWRPAGCFALCTFT